MKAGVLRRIAQTNLKTAHRMKAALEEGVVWLKCLGDGDMKQPFGGYKQSCNSHDKHMDSLSSYMPCKSAWFNLI